MPEPKDTSGTENTENGKQDEVVLEEWWKGGEEQNAQPPTQPTQPTADNGDDDDIETKIKQDVAEKIETSRTETNKEISIINQRTSVNDFLTSDEGAMYRPFKKQINEAINSGKLEGINSPERAVAMILGASNVAKLAAREAQKAMEQASSSSRGGNNGTPSGKNLDASSESINGAPSAEEIEKMNPEEFDKFLSDAKHGKYKTGQ